MSLFTVGLRDNARLAALLNIPAGGRLHSRDHSDPRDRAEKANGNVGFIFRRPSQQHTDGRRESVKQNQQDVFARVADRVTLLASVAAPASTEAYYPNSLPSNRETPGMLARTLAD